jgi:hypothetical protein
MTVSNPIDMPNTPSAGTIYTAGNDVQYIYDGEKWIAYIVPGAAENYWQQFALFGDAFLAPIKLGEQVRLRDAAGTVKLILDSDGDIDCETIQATTTSFTGLTIATQKTGGTTTASITSAGMLSCENINMESFPALP